MKAIGFERVLVANRGEIAVRILRGLRELGTTAIAVCSEADRNALHTRVADRVVEIGPAEPAASYLDMDRVLAAAKESGAEAIHPGYGFLSENASFARACQREGFVFIGPGAEAMEALGSKRRAKELAEAAGVPCVPGFDGKGASNAEFVQAAEKIGYPLLIKASAGGGGRGMRLVERAEDFLEALAAGMREAKQAFGDDTTLLEKYIHPARHIEVQILGDGKDAIALGERECSVQRRHQKVLEESPSPIVDEALRKRLEAAAVSLAKHVGYSNAGTVEFLLGPDGDFYFLEVNTRLQVEHPVTEFVTGLDLVHLQIAIASGRKLEALLPQARILRGHSIEARICAEEPEKGFLPASGKLLVCVEAQGPGIRLDNGYDAGSEVSPHYDSLLAKLIVYAPNRQICLRRMACALRETAMLGVPTNIDFLLRVIESEDFRRGTLRTDFLDQHPWLATGSTELADAASIPQTMRMAAGLATRFAHEASGNSSAGPHKQSAIVRQGPWDQSDSFRIGEGAKA